MNTTKLTKTNTLCRTGLLQSTIIISFSLLTLVQGSCKKMVDVDAPVTSLNGDNVFATDATAISVLTGIYLKLSQGQSGLTEFRGSVSSVSSRSGLSSDELSLYSGVTDKNKVGFYTNSLISNNFQSIGTDLWEKLYSYLYSCNDAIERLSSATNLTPSIKKQLLGESKFLRAFFYFYLVNLYGDVPLVISTDYVVNSKIPRSPTLNVYQQIITDLEDAKDLLSSNYLKPDLLTVTNEKVRPNKSVATALLARTYLYIKDFISAEKEASNIINSSYSLDTLNGVFFKNSKEAIWQLQPVNIGRNTEDAYLFILPSNGPNNGDNSVYLSNMLMASFDSSDKRKINGNWIKSVVASGKTYYYPFKYKNNSGTVSEYLMIFRLGEQYLIRAEARANLGNFDGAISDLNAIRGRAGLSTYNGLLSQSQLLSAIMQERQVELFTEWGHRWFDLKRTGKIDEVMSKVTPLKGNGISWLSHQQFYPVPFKDILKNTAIIQTNGY